MKFKSKGKHGEVALKIDISKAYDKIGWRFLKGMMIQLGFSHIWINLDYDVCSICQSFSAH